MKQIKLFLLVIFMMASSVSMASATPVLYDWWIDVNTTVYEIFPDEYLAPEVGGEITAVTGFSLFTDDYGFDVPNALGSVEVTFNPAAAGTYFIDAMFDVEIDEFDNTFFNESGGVVGSFNGSIDDDFGDIAFLIEETFILAADEWAVATFVISDAAPGSGPYLWHSDDDTGETIYLTSTVEIMGGGPGPDPIPEPSTLILLGIGLLGLARTSRKKL